MIHKRWVKNKLVAFSDQGEMHYKIAGQNTFVLCVLRRKGDIIYW